MLTWTQDNSYSWRAFIDKHTQFVIVTTGDKYILQIPGKVTGLKVETFNSLEEAKERAEKLVKD